MRKEFVNINYYYCFVKHIRVISSTLIHEHLHYKTCITAITVLMHYCIITLKKK